MSKASTPKGTRDFSPLVVNQRNYISQIIREAFVSFGFAPIETPSFENYSTLMGKYGEEGDRLIFKILKSGDFLAKSSEEDLKKKNSKAITPSISDKALRYDLTVPFARYVVQHQNELTFPFKRYQIQPVWRADRPQKGRYREFYQCDADVVGSTSLWQEVDFVQLYDSVFTALQLKTSIQINNRKVLTGLAEVADIQVQLIDFTVALDKLDKIGKEKVEEEMIQKGISTAAIEKLAPLFDIKGEFTDQLDQLKDLLQSSTIGLEGIAELAFIQEKTAALGLQSAKLELNVTLARGLNYYTGSIFEVKALDVELGSIGAGGRYDDLTGIFGLKNMPGVGVSFGLDRIYYCLEELKLFPPSAEENLQVLFINFGEKEAGFAQQAIRQLRQKNVSCELYPDTAKMKKQMQYANNKKVQYVALIGENELEKQQITLKEMSTGKQKTLNLTDFILTLT